MGRDRGWLQNKTSQIYQPLPNSICLCPDCHLSPPSLSILAFLLFIILTLLCPHCQLNPTQRQFSPNHAFAFDDNISILELSK